jgi:phenolic acid decarboxylase
VIAFILEHPEKIAAYLRDQERLWEELRDKHPLPTDMLQRFVRSRDQMVSALKT